MNAQVIHLPLTAEQQVQLALEAARSSHPAAKPATCPTPDCKGDGRYSAPGRGHATHCSFPILGAAVSDVAVDAGEVDPDPFPGYHFVGVQEDGSFPALGMRRYEFEEGEWSGQDVSLMRRLGTALIAMPLTWEGDDS